MTKTTRTLNPLPFEHLEPKRFEDLVRQIAYGFRTWRSLEATGRSGSDGGYDIRGWEIVPNADRDERIESEDDFDLPVALPSDADRRWLIQCKREKQIGPKKIAQYFDEMPDETISGLYGFVFAASCNLSKTSRDVLRNNCRDAGIAECHIWSHAEIEDMLFQPVNDGILFAYFGISLTIRKRTIRSQLRARLVAKRKAIAVLGSGSIRNQRVLLIDPEETRYPFQNEGGDFLAYRWRLLTFTGHDALGLKFAVQQYYAFLSKSGTEWDVADAYNMERDQQDDPWITGSRRADMQKQRMDIDTFFRDELDEEERGFMTTEVIIPYSEIIDIDRHGDNHCGELPQIYMSFEKFSKGWSIPFKWGFEKIVIPPVLEFVESGHGSKMTQTRVEGREVYVDSSMNRTTVFQEKYRDQSKTTRLLSNKLLE